MRDTKIAIVMLNTLLPWQKLNVAAFLGGAVAIRFPETHGREFVDAGGVKYLPFIRQPILLYAAPDFDALKRIYDRARDRDLAIGIYTAPLFKTKNETQNHTEIGSRLEGEQDYVGLVVYGNARSVEKAVKGLKLHE